MATADLRYNIIRLVRILASKEEQVAYERDVPIANVPSELVCMWFNDLYHPSGDLFLAAFNPVERDRLARFHIFYYARIKQLPTTLAELHRNTTWLDVMAEARRVLDDLNWVMEENKQTSNSGEAIRVKRASTR